ncbi:MAG: InlB B-repeat-containing protein [Dissulfurispiraceae bacterium]
MLFKKPLLSCIFASALLTLSVVSAGAWKAPDPGGSGGSADPSGPLTWIQGNYVQSIHQVSSVPFKNSNTANSLLLCSVSCEVDLTTALVPSGDVVISDSAGNSWANVTSVYYNYKIADGYYTWQYNSLFYADNVAGKAGQTITVDISNYYQAPSGSEGPWYCTGMIEEFAPPSSGLLVPDGTVYGFQNGLYTAAEAVTLLTGPTITPNVNGDLIYAILWDDSSVSGWDTFSAGIGYTLMQEDVTSGIGNLADEYSVQGTAGSIAPTFNFSSTSANFKTPYIPEQWTILAAAFTAMSNGLPLVTTQAVSGISMTSAIANGTIVATGSSSVTTEGFVYGTSSVSTNPGNVPPSSSGYAYNADNVGTFSVGAFTVSLAGLTANTTYYGRAYSQNSSGYSYGGEVSFTSTSVPMQYSLTVTDSGTGSGTVTSSPGGINCGTTCSNLYNPGALVILTATPTNNSTFSGWAGGGCTGTGTCSITIDTNTAVTATFTAPVQTYTITASAGTGGSITPSGTTMVNSGGSQKYTIRPSSGYSISMVLVDGISVGTPSSYTFSDVTADHTIMVMFIANKHRR